MEWNLSEILSYVLYLLSDKRILILVIVLFVSILFAVFSLILYLKTRKKKKIEKNQESQDRENNEENSHLSKISRLRKINNPKEALSELGREVKQISRGYLKTDKEMTFGEISEKLREKNKTALADFCNEIEYLIYSEEEPTKERVFSLIDKFEKALKKPSRQKETAEKLKKNLKERRKDEGKASRLKKLSRKIKHHKKFKKSRRKRRIQSRARKQRL